MYNVYSLTLYILQYMYFHCTSTNSALYFVFFIIIVVICCVFWFSFGAMTGGKWGWTEFWIERTFLCTWKYRYLISSMTMFLTYFKNMIFVWKSFIWRKKYFAFLFFCCFFLPWFAVLSLKFKVKQLIKHYIELIFCCQMKCWFSIWMTYNRFVFTPIAFIIYSF